MVSKQQSDLGWNLVTLSHMAGQTKNLAGRHQVLSAKLSIKRALKRVQRLCGLMEWHACPGRHVGSHASGGFAIILCTHLCTESTGAGWETGRPHSSANMRCRAAVPGGLCRSALGKTQ